MARIYISGPMTGDKGYKERFLKTEEELRKQGYDVINPARVDMLLPNASYEDYMKVDMFLLDMCDEIYMLKGWRKSCGANREYGYAMAKDYITHFESFEKNKELCKICHNEVCKNEAGPILRAQKLKDCWEEAEKRWEEGGTNADSN